MQPTKSTEEEPYCPVEDRAIICTVPWPGKVVYFFIINLWVILFFKLLNSTVFILSYLILKNELNG